jgi:hypothetical protein
VEKEIKLPPMVEIKLSTVGFPFSGDVRGTPYPVWQLAEPKQSGLRDTIKELNVFLQDFGLTSYFRLYREHGKQHLASCLEIAKCVPVSLRSEVSSFLDVTFQETIYSPCLFWTISESAAKPSILDEKVSGVRALVSRHHLITYKYRGEPQNHPAYDSVAVVHSDDRYDLIRFEEVYAPGYGIYETNVISALEQLDHIFGFEFLAHDMLRLKLLPVGEEMFVLRDWAFRLCPDIYYEGADLSNLEAGLVELYWDDDF